MKVLLIGIDGATFDIIKPLAEQGYLPTFKKLLATCAHSELNSTIPPITVPATPTIITGCNPGKHNMFAFTHRKVGTYDEIITTISDRKAKPIWKILEEHNKTTGAFLLPYTYPPESTNGFVVSGFGTSDFEKAFNPIELREELKKNVQDYNTFERLKEEECTDRIQYIRKDLTAISKTTTSVIKYLIKNKRTDLLLVWMDECEKAHHQGWKYCDPRFPQYYSFGSKNYSTVIRENYQNVDAAIGELLKTIDKDTNVIIMSDHGFGAAYNNSACYDTNEWLAKEGLMFIKNNTRSRYNFLGKLAEKLRLSAIIRKYITSKMVYHISKTRKKDVDWTKTKAYSAGNLYYIYVNLKGREPNGIVKQKDYGLVRGQIIRKLNSLVDRRNGKKILRVVLRGEDVFFGKYVENAPDIVTLPNELPTVIVDGLIALPNEKMPDPNLIAAQHKQKGMLILYGSAFSKQQIINPQMWDLAPTILYLLNIPIPKSMDGRVLLEAVNKSYSRKLRTLHKTYAPDEIEDIDI